MSGVFDDWQEVRSIVLHDGDILFNRTNSAELVGKTAIFRGVKPMAYAGYLIRLRANEKADPEFVSGVLNSRYGKRTLRGICKSIIGMANINGKEVQAIPIPQPPLPLQREFAVQVLAVERLKASQRTSLGEAGRALCFPLAPCLPGEL